MNFELEVQRFGVKLGARADDVLQRCADEVYQSIVFGSALTGAPGQPVGSGRLRQSWRVQYMGASVALIATDVEYAREVEENIGGAQFANHGPHSVALTRAGWQRIVARAVAVA